jgi:sigma-B regulation protein RsbU (phosphoserine phosphatase)
MATAKLLYRRLDALFGSLKTKRPQSKLIEGFVEDALANLKDDLRLRAGLVYAERRDNFALVKSLGEPGTPSPRRSIPRSRRSPSWRATASTSSARPRRPARRSSSAFLPKGAAAGLIVGQRPHRYAILFLLADGWQLEELDFALNTIRASLDARLVDARVRGSFREAAEIQQSLLVEEPPAFSGFELAARSLPAEEVGGDFYDFHDLGEGTLGLAIGDASGHGLPAALLVRRRGDGPQDGDREGAEGRARVREAQPRDPPLAAVEPLRERVLRGARARRQPRLRERRLTSRRSCSSASAPPTRSARSSSATAAP